MKTKIPLEGAVGNCPHCNVNTRFESLGRGDSKIHYRFTDGILYEIYGVKCPACSKLIVGLSLYVSTGTGPALKTSLMLYPLGSTRLPVPPEVPKEVAQDYTEACLVEAVSKKAAAALARRCLQNLLHDPNAGNVKPDDLSKEIDQVIKTLPTVLAESIDAVRNVGNFGAHPIKCQHTGEIVDVEPQEAEWLLDILEELFDHYYVKPQRIKQKRDVLNKKLSDAGKPPLK